MFSWRLQPRARLVGENLPQPPIASMSFALRNGARFLACLFPAAWAIASIIAEGRNKNRPASGRPDLPLLYSSKGFATNASHYVVGQY
jgi:hypothetical protein